MPQFLLADQAALKQRLQAVLAVGGEGLMLHQVDAPSQTGRREVLLRLKAQDDAEALGLAHLPGGGKYAALLGGLRVRNEQGQVFVVLGSGFSDAQRRTPPAVASLVSYRSRGMKGQGLPRFATFARELEPATPK